MAEFRDFSVDQSNVNESENDAVVPDDFPNDLSLNQSNVNEMENDAIVPDDFPNDLSFNQSNVNERENGAVVPDDFPNELSIEVIQNIELVENMLEDIVGRRAQEENNLLSLTFDLKGITIHLLEMQLKLYDLKHKKFKRELKKCADGLNDLIFKFYNIPNRNENPVEYNNLQQKLESLSAARKQLETFAGSVPDCNDDEDKFLNEMHGDFYKYREIYKKCAGYIENFLERAEKRLKISNVPRESQEELCVLLSVLEENLDSYGKILLSSKKEFEKFELIFKNDVAVLIQNTDNRVNLFIATIKKAKLAYLKLKPAIFDILNFDCAIRRDI